MTWIDIVILLVIAGVCGAIGRAIAGSRRGGILVCIALGFVGALVGMFVARALKLPELVSIGGFPVVWAILGSALFVAIISLLTKPRL